MKCKHIFINECDVTDNMRVHVIWIGESRRDQEKRDRVTLAASKCRDIYFQRYSFEVCEFLGKLSMQLYPNMSPRQASEKFYECNVKNSSLDDVLKNINSISYPSNVTNPKLLNHEIKFWKER